VTAGTRNDNYVPYTRAPLENLKFERPRVLLLNPHLGGGGSEKVFARLACGLSHEKYELHLGVVTGAEVAAGAIPTFVTVHMLRAKRVRSAAFMLLSLVRQLRPQVVLCGMFHLNFLILMVRPFFPRSVQVIVPPKWDGQCRSAPKRAAHLYAPALSRVLPSCKPRDLPVNGHGQRHRPRDSSFGAEGDRLAEPYRSGEAPGCDFRIVRARDWPRSASPRYRKTLPGEGF